MLSREVWGWRILALLLVALLVSTVPQAEKLKSEWEDSIDGKLLSGEEITEEPQSDDVEETQTEDSNSEDDFAVESTDDENEKSSDSAPPESSPMDFADEENSNPIENNNSPQWILPATQIIVFTMMAIMAVGLISSTSIAILSGEAARLSIYLAIIGPIVGLTQRGEGGIFTRGRILGFIEAHPGIHFSALRDALSLGNGVTAHHIQILEKEGRIISWIDGKLRRFASSGVDQNRLEEIQNPVVGMQVAILQILADSDNLGIKSGELRAKLETSRQLLSYHMKQLTQRKFVESSGKGRALRWSLLEAGKKQLETSHHLNNPISD